MKLVIVWAVEHMPVAEYVDAQEVRGAHTMVCSLSGNDNGAAECAMCGANPHPAY